MIDSVYVFLPIGKQIAVPTMIIKQDFILNIFFCCGVNSNLLVSVGAKSKQISKHRKKNILTILHTE